MTDPPPPQPPEGGATPQPAARPSRFLRSRTDKVVAGVCGGLGRYLGIDPIWVRIGAVLIVIFVPGIGLLTAVVLYVVAVLVVPEEGAEAAGHRSAAETARTGAGTDADPARVVFGVVLIGVGGLLLARLLLPELIHARLVGPLVLIAVGLLVVIQAMRR